MDRKYEFTGETKTVDSVILHRIRAVRDIYSTSRIKIAKEGDIGGWIENESNLSHDGGCWVGEEACVYDFAHVHDDSLVSDSAKICGTSIVCDKAWIKENSLICENALVEGNSEICGYAYICGNANVRDYAKVYGHAHIGQRSLICGNSEIFGEAHVGGLARIIGNAKIFGEAKVHGYASIYGNAKIEKTSDYFTIGPIGSRDDYTTFFKGLDGDIYVVCGCFRGNIREFTEAVKITHGSESKYASDYNLAIALARNKLR